MNHAQGTPQITPGRDLIDAHEVSRRGGGIDRQRIAVDVTVICSRQSLYHPTSELVWLQVDRNG